MATVGRALLVLGLLVAVYGIGASLYGARRGGTAWVDSGRRAVYALALLFTVAFAILEVAFLRDDFHYDVVAGHSSTTTPTLFKLAAPWSSQEGSLLLWVWLLSLWSSLVLFLTRRRLREIVPYATAVLLGFAAFFAFLTVFTADPFATSAVAPAEGAGLNPLLRHGSMMIHPPMLYSGYTLFTIPFAFAIGALVTRSVGAEWMQATRRFALGAWLFLGIGILLGARWSYTELGWGGYWAWDPVENAALLPWLCGTAYIHSIMIQEKRGMLRIWNVSLVLATGTLAIMGTFLVRSGILQSIHAFVQPGSLLRWSFLGLIALMAVGSIALVVSRRQALRSEHRLDSLLSREAVFLFQNLVLVALTFVIWWGTFFPLISEAITGHQTAVGPPWFDRYTVPLALVLVLLSGIGPLIAWRRVTTANLRRNFVWPVGAALGALAAMLAAGGIARDPGALILFACVVFVLAAVAQELWRGARARRALAGEAPPVALVQLVRRNRRRYGGYIVHAGFAVLLLGVAASSSFAHVQDVSLRPGQSAKVGGYTFRYVRPTSALTRQRISLGAVLDVSRSGKHVTTLRTTHDYYPSQDLSLGPVGRFFNGEDETRIGWQAGLRRDIWSSVLPNITHLQGLISQGNAVFEKAMQDAGRGGAKAAPAINLLLQARDAAVVGIVRRYVAESPPADFHLLVSPLISWLWIGGLIVLGGGLIALWPAPAAVRRRVGAVYSARLARELARP